MSSVAARPPLVKVGMAGGTVPVARTPCRLMEFLKSLALNYLKTLVKASQDVGDCQPSQAGRLKPATTHLPPPGTKITCGAHWEFYLWLWVPGNVLSASSSVVPGLILPWVTGGSGREAWARLISAAQGPKPEPRQSADGTHRREDFKTQLGSFLTCPACHQEKGHDEHSVASRETEDRDCSDQVRRGDPRIPVLSLWLSVGSLCPARPG